MANAFKQEQQNKQVDKHAELVRECQALGEKGSRVEAVKKYRAATGASLKTAQQALWGS